MEFTSGPLAPFGTLLDKIEIATNLSLKMPLIFRLTRVLQENKCINPATRQLVELCFDEALTNAMVHGNQMDPSKMVVASVFCDQESWGAIIEDQGDGFSQEDLPSGEDAEDPLRETGRGILLMDGYLDALKYGGKGNQAMMVRHREAAEEVPVAQEEPAIVAPEMEDGMLVFVDEEPEAAASAPAPGPDLAPATVAGEEVGGGLALLSTDADVAVIEILASRLSDANADRFKGVVSDVIASHALILVDMTRVEYISSVILGAFASFIKLLQPKSGKIKVCGATPVVVEVFRSMRFDKLLDLQSDREAGVAALR